MPADAIWSLDLPFAPPALADPDFSDFSPDFSVSSDPLHPAIPNTKVHIETEIHWEIR